jgi:hypothetical protein
MGISPESQGTIAFPFIEGECLVNLVEPAFVKLECSQNGPGNTIAVKRHHELPDFGREHSLTFGPTRRTLGAGKHKLDKLVGKFGAIAERECLVIPPGH